MKTVNEMTENKRAWWLTRRWRIGISVIAVVGLAWACQFGIESYKRRLVEARIEALRAAGAPTTLDELTAKYVLAPGVRNWAPEFMQCRVLLQANQVTRFSEDDRICVFGSQPFVAVGKEFNNADPTPVGTTWPVLGLVEKCLLANKGALDLAHAALDAGGDAVFPVQHNRIEFTSSILMDFPCDLTGFLALECHVALHRGRPKEALAAMRRLFRLRSSVANSPDRIAPTLAVACVSRAKTLLETALPQMAFDDGELKSLQMELDAIDVRSDLKRALSACRARALAQVSDLENFRHNGLYGWVKIAAELRRLDAANDFLDAFEKLENIPKLPWTDAMSACGRVDTWYQQRVPLKVDFSNGAGNAPVMARRFRRNSTFVSTFEVFPAAECNFKLAVVGIAIHRFYQKYKALPSRLADLVPAFLPDVPADPLGDGPLRYRIEPDGYRLWSVGTDGVDNNGVDDPTVDVDKRDLVFHARYPPMHGGAKTRNNGHLDCHGASS